jgi:hypothetical protein
MSGKALIVSGIRAAGGIFHISVFNSTSDSFGLTDH